MFAGLFRSGAAQGARSSGAARRKSPPGQRPERTEAAGKGRKAPAGARAAGPPAADGPAAEGPTAAAPEEGRAGRRKAARRKAVGGARVEPPPAPGGSGGAPTSKAVQRLKGSRFRWLNDTLYHIPGQEAKDMFDKDPSLSHVYHEGFRAQRAKWPCDPLDDVIKWLSAKVPSTAVIGDFGCGEARLAATLSDRTVHSFDLISVNERVTACNIAHVPLPDASLDIAVFCLSLMGVDWLDFVSEARRCLRDTGRLHIVEVESRFATGINKVVSSIEALGFQRLISRKIHDYFVELRFACSDQNPGKKRKESRSTDASALLAGCKYRRR